MSDDAQARPPSPCINVCTLDAAGLCVGCLRTLAQIAAWSSMSAAEQWRVIEEVKQRQKLAARDGASAQSR